MLPAAQVCKVGSKHSLIWRRNFITCFQRAQIYRMLDPAQTGKVDAGQVKCFLLSVGIVMEYLHLQSLIEKIDRSAHVFGPVSHPGH